MKNYIIIHGSFGSNKEHYLPWLENELKNRGFDVINLSFPIGVGNQTYENWEKVLNNYKEKITPQTVFIARSIGPIFAIKYLMKNNLHINKLISISGFNNYSVDGGNYDKVNKTMFVKNLKKFKNYCNQVVCFYSENDPYVTLSALKHFEKQIANISINIKNGGHFNTDSGYGKGFKELLMFID